MKLWDCFSTVPFFLQETSIYMIFIVNQHKVNIGELFMAKAKVTQKKVSLSDLNNHNI